MLLSSPFWEKYRYFEFFLLPFSASLDSTNLYIKLTHVQKLSIWFPVWVVTSERWHFRKLEKIVPPNVVWCWIFLKNIVLPQHIFNPLFPLLDLNVFLLNWRLHCLLIHKETVRDFVLHKTLLRLSWVLIWLLQTSMFWVTHVPVRRSFWTRPDNNRFWLVLFVFLHIWSLNW